MRIRWFSLFALFTFLLGSSVACGPECPEGQTKCGEACVNTQSDRAHCGKCDAKCEDGNICNAGKCEVSCQKGLTECGGTCANTKTDVKNCGDCGTECKDGESCSEGKCEPSCPEGQKFCDGTCINTDTDNNNCGGCGTKCKAGETCSAGKCSIVCPTDLTACDGNCTNTKADRSNCGACGTKCADGEVCDAGSCKTSCQKDQTECSGACVDTKTSIQHCGACGTACKGGEICKAGKCELICGTGYEKCGDACVDVQSSRAHCGKCDTACKSNEACNAGKCELNCPKDYTDCSGSCANIQNNVKHCGACGTACGANEVCDAGKCKAFCQTGFTDCSNSCSDTQTDGQNCGACGNKCNSNSPCQAGKCVESCAKGETTCSSVCTNTKSNIQHCGACGTACSTGEVCIDSKCAACTDCPNWATKLGSFNSDSVFSIAVDTNGNTYATGAFIGFTTMGGTTLNSNGSADLFVIKMSPAGRVMWAVNAGGSGADTGNSIAVDKSGNAYITGSFNGTAKFGTTLLTSAGSTDIFVAQLDKDGKWGWVKSFGGTSTDSGNSITVDGTGNSYIAGGMSSSVAFGSTTLTSAGGLDIFVAKLDNTGKLGWAKSAAGKGSYDQANTIGMDSKGNVYVAGRFYTSLTWGTTTLTSKTSFNYDIFVGKIDATGKFGWLTVAGGNSYDYTFGMAFDSQDNIYVTGVFGSSGAVFGTTTLASNGGNDIYVAKLDSAGKWLWALGMGGAKDDQGLGIGVDSKGVIYATGFFDGKGTFGQVGLAAVDNSKDIFLAQLTPAGKVAGAIRMGGKGSDAGNHLVVDSKDNIYIGGEFSEASSFGKVQLLTSGSSDGFVAKYAKPAKPFCPAGGGICNGVCINFASDNNNCGTCGNKCTGGKLCGGGVCKTCTDCPTHLLTGTSSVSGSYGYGEATTSDAAGNMYYAGRFNKEMTFGTTKLTSLGGSDIFVAKADKTGKWIWAKSFGSASSDYAYAIAVDKNENVYITGQYGSSSNFMSVGIQQLKTVGSSDIYVIKLDKNGGPVWGATGGGSGIDYGYGIGIDSSGNIYVSGRSNGIGTFGLHKPASQGGNDAFVGKLSSTGTWLWAKQFGGTASDYIRSAVVDAAGNTYITGYSYSSSGMKFGLISVSLGSTTEVFVAKINKDGVPLWAIAGGGAGSQEAHDIAVNSAGDVYITGYLPSSGGTFGTTKLNTPSGRSMFVMQVDKTGKWGWGKSFGPTGSFSYARGFGIGLNSKGYIYLSGDFEKTMAVGPFSLTSKGSYDVVLIKMDTKGNVVGATSGGGTSSDYIRNMHVDAAGNSYMAGYTSSSNMTFSSQTYKRGTTSTPAPFLVTFGPTPCPITGGFGVCGEVCANLQTDANNCGTCSNKCATGTTCQAGTCK